MPKTSLLVLTLAGLALPILPVAAAPAATQQEADRLKAVFERYVGHPTSGEAGSVSVTPEGTAYRAIIDYKLMMRPLETFGLSVEPATQSVLLTPNDNGTWQVTSDAMPPLTMHVKDQTIAMASSTYKYQGVYDPKLGIFLDQTATQDGVTLDQEAPALVQHRRSGHTILTQKAVPADGDRANIDAHYALSDVTAQAIMRSPPPPASVEVAPAAPPVELSYTLPTSTLDVHIDRLRTWSLLDLWAFFVAHPSHDAITASQEELRGLLKAALPVLSGLKEGGATTGMTMQSQFGEFKAGKLAASLEIADLAGAGKIAVALSADDLVVPTMTLPPWSAGLLPTTLDIRPTVTGVHVDEGAKEAVDSFDLNHDGFVPEQSQKIGHILWPGDGKVTLAPSHIGTPLLDLKFEGEATIGDVPAGQLTVTATGIDKAIAALQDAAAADPTAGQVLAQLVAAKNLGKLNPDGSFVWVVEASASGPLSVNGIPLK